MKMALQLYSVRDCIKSGADVPGVFAKLKKMGYDGVEFAGTYGLSAEELKKMLDDAGLVCVGTHTGVDNFKADKLEETYEFYKTLGCSQIGVGGANTKTDTNLQKVLDTLGGANKVLEPRGMRVYFHNHTGEFKKTLFTKSPLTIIDRLKEVCYLEIDTYWSYRAGIDNTAYLNDNKDKITAIHLKDGNDGTPSALGEGTNDIPAIVKATADIGLDWVIVENDDPTPDGLSDVARSAEYLKKLL